LKRPKVEQSNTSIIVGATILKAFRRLEAGVHPEVEIGAFLTDSAGFKNVPRLLGTVTSGRPGEEPVVLCVLQELIDGSVDGWRVVTDALGGITKDPTPDASTNLLSLARQLGLRTADALSTTRSVALQRIRRQTHRRICCRWRGSSAFVPLNSIARSPPAWNLRSRPSVFQRNG
jgi:predicted trehalose synthase